jgi:hypothetical protein
MEATRRKVLIALVALCVALAAQALAQAPRPTPSPPPPGEGSIIDLHGPDGMPFSTDDPLRVNVAAHRGVFFLSYNSVGAFRVHANIPPVNPIPPAVGERTELGFINLSDNTVTRIGLHPLSRQWDQPVDIGQRDPPPGWGDDADFIVQGSALRHEINGGDMLASRNRDADAAVKLDPAWIRLGPGETAGCPGGMMAQLMQMMTDLGIDYVALERFSMDKGQIVSATRLPSNFVTAPNEFSNALGASFRVRIGEVWSRLKGGLGGMIVGLLAATLGKLFNLEVNQGWIRMPIQDIKNIAQVPPGMREGVAQQIAANPGLTGRVTPEAVLEAAMGNRPDTCQAMGVADPNVCETELRPLIDQTRTALKAVVNGPRTIQGLMDCVAKYVPGNPPRYGFREWRDLTKSKLSGIVDRVVKIPLKDELQRLLVGEGNQIAPEDSGRPMQSGAFIFNSAYFFGPKGRWLIQRNPGAEAGLVENYVYARLNQVNPYDVEGPAGEQTIRWRQLDLITQKARAPEPPRLPWPPATTRPGAAERDYSAWGKGTCQLIGDEAANGLQGGDIPEQVSTMAMAVSPDERGGRLNVAFTVKSSLTSGQRRGDLIPWARVPANPNEALPLPPGYTQAGRGSRAFRVAVSNRRLGRVPQGFRFNWDFDGNTQIDSHYGNVVRRIQSAGQVATCYVIDPVSLRTGFGMEKVTP